MLGEGAGPRYRPGEVPDTAKPEYKPEQSCVQLAELCLAAAEAGNTEEVANLCQKLLVACRTPHLAPRSTHAMRGPPSHGGTPNG